MLGDGVAQPLVVDINVGRVPHREDDGVVGVALEKVVGSGDAHGAVRPSEDD